MGLQVGTVAWRLHLVWEYERLRNYSKVAKLCDTDPRTVKLWVQRFRDTGDVQDKQRSGRPSAGLGTPDVVQLLAAEVRAGSSCPQMQSTLKASRGITVHHETVRAFVKGRLARPLRPRRKPGLTAMHKRQRLQFCRKWVHKCLDNVVISDSKIFMLCPKGVGHKVWVLYGDKAPIRPSYRNCTRVHVYAAVSKWGKTALFVTAGTTGFQCATKGVTAALYTQLLEEQLIPACRQLMQHRPACQRSTPWVFQQDGAPAHKARSTQAWLKQHADFSIMAWPPNSPDLSWIENVWGLVARQLQMRSNLTSATFQQAVFEEWDRVPHKTLVDLHDSMKRRMQACIRSNGGSTKY